MSTSTPDTHGSIAGDGAAAQSDQTFDYRTKSELVYQHLRRMIVNNQLRAGEHLYLDVIATQFGVSTNPVREALRRLQSEGLVDNRPHAGTIVAAIDIEKIEVHFMIRGALEGLAVRLAASHVSPQELARLEEMDRQLRSLAERKDFAAWNEQNIAFYRFLFDCCRSPELVAMIDLQRDRSPRFSHFPDALEERARNAHVQRGQVLAAVASGEAETAERLHRESVAQTGQLLCVAMRAARAETQPTRTLTILPRGGALLGNPSKSN